MPAQGLPANPSPPRTVVGNGTAASCTGDAFIGAVALGGVVTFDCGPDPVVIKLDRPAKIFNDKGPDIVIDGGGRVTLSGQGKTRLLYMNTCDRNQVWTTATCQNQDHPRLTVQNLTFIDGDATAEAEHPGGGAIFARGGQLRLINTRFFRNRCAEMGPDVGGGAVRALDQFEDKPLLVVNSTFGGAPGLGNRGANGGGLSSIGVSWTVVNSVLSYNLAVGAGGNPAKAGTPGGGSGGAIYNDGNRMTLSVCGTRIENNQATTHGSAVFFVSNDKTGDVKIERSVIKGNTGGTWYPKYPQLSHHPETQVEVTASTIEP